MLAIPSPRIRGARAGSVPVMPSQASAATLVKAAVACIATLGALSACASGDTAGEPAPASASSAPESAAPESTAPESAAPESTAPESAAPESTVPESAAPESTAPESTAPETAAPEQAGPQYVADAILAELLSGQDSTLTDQLVTIAMSPVTRQMTETLGLEARLKTRGDATLLVISGPDSQCTVTVSDPPREARGVSCR